VCVVKRESTRARKAPKQWASECHAGVFVTSACREAITFAEPSQSGVNICGESRFRVSLIATKALVVANVRKNRHVHSAWQITEDILMSPGWKSQHPESSRAESIREVDRQTDTKSCARNISRKQLPAKCSTDCQIRPKRVLLCPLLTNHLSTCPIHIYVRSHALQLDKIRTARKSTNCSRRWFEPSFRGRHALHLLTQRPPVICL
jgi:hypothetical protein